MPADSPFNPGDAFTTFWSDFMNRTASSGATPPGTQTPEWMNQMRRAFFDSMAQSADQFMRSEAFLKSMKQSMDNSLAWQKMLNQYLQKGVSGMPVPDRADNDEVVQLIRAMENRLATKLGELSQRVEKLEKHAEPIRGRPGK